MKTVAVVGLGNILMGDDGVGVRVIEELGRTQKLPRNITLIEAETAGISILPQLDEVDAVILVDAVDFEGGYGDVKVYTDFEIGIERPTPVSMHEAGIKDMLSLLRLKSSSLPRIVLVGIKPKNIRLEVGLSPEVVSNIMAAEMAVLDEINSISG